MSRLPMGTAHREVLLKLTRPGRDTTWCKDAGDAALYESRALTETLCVGLSRMGFMDEKPHGNGYAYSVNLAGSEKAAELRRHL